MADGETDESGGGAVADGLVVDATTVDAEITLNNLICTDDMGRIRKLSRFQRSFGEYIGPDFATLDDRIQTALVEYIEGYGID